MKKAILIEIITAFFVLLFVYAATSKLIDYQKFKVQLSQSPLLTVFANWVAWAIPVIEITIAVLLLPKQTRRFGLYASFTLMSLFTFYIFIITQFSDYIPCSCGGILQHMSWNQHLIFNGACVLTVAAGILLYKPNYT